MDSGRSGVTGSSHVQGPVAEEIIWGWYGCSPAPFPLSKKEMAALYKPLEGALKICSRAGLWFEDMVSTD